MKRLLLLLCLAACAPAATFSLTPVVGVTALEFVSEFQPILARLGIEAKSGVVQRYQSQGEPLLEVTQAFYQTYPGFCPLRSGSFWRSSVRSKFMTITAKGNDVRLFVYEPEQQGVLYAAVEAGSKDVLEVAPCPK
jgi:hypothetical protein